MRGTPPRIPAEKVEIESVLHPGKVYRVDAVKFAAAKAATLGMLPRSSPGLTQKEMGAAIRKALSEEQFPGSTSGWLMKSVQLDLEAKAW